MFKIYDGREHFYQWDIDRKLIVEDSSITEVHFCNRTDSCSLVCETYVEDGITLANVPNILLQTDWKIHVYAYDGKHTKHDECFEVISRSKPADYIYTETEILNYDALLERMAALEENTINPEELEKSIGDYLTENPVEFASHSGNSAYADTAGTALQAEKAYEAENATSAYRALYAEDAHIASYARRNMDEYELIPQVTSTAVMDTLTYRFIHNTITHIDGGATTIEFVLNNGSYPDYYSSELTFSVGNVAPMLVYPEAPIINWVGTDCSVSEDNFSIFAPQSHTHYDILFYFNGVNITGLVNGYKLASGNA